MQGFILFSQEIRNIVYLIKLTFKFFHFIVFLLQLFALLLHFLTLLLKILFKDHQLILHVLFRFLGNLLQISDISFVFQNLFLVGFSQIVYFLFLIFFHKLK